MTSNTTSERLHASILWFAVIAAILSSGIALLMSRAAPNLAELTTAAVLATILSSILFWWLFIVLPRRVSIVRGILAGIMSIITTLFLMWWIYEAYVVVVQHSEFTFTGTLLLSLFAVIAVCITPLGWIFFAIAGSAGGLLAWYLRCSVLPKVNIDNRVF